MKQIILKLDLKMSRYKFFDLLMLFCFTLDSILFDFYGLCSEILDIEV